MVSCTEFIPAYSQLFNFLEKKEGEEGVMKYWEYISDEYVKPLLAPLLEEFGIEGCYKYWSKTLNEEAADFEMTLDGNNFCINMIHCPSKGRLLSYKHIIPYHNYCGHCTVLYKRVFEKYGLSQDYDISCTDQAKCVLKIFKKD